MVRLSLIVIVCALSTIHAANNSDGPIKKIQNVEYIIENKLNNLVQFIEFNLHTRALQGNSVLVTRFNWKETKKHIMLDKEFKFYVHGWLASKTSASSTSITNSYLRNTDVNVFVVDWSFFSDNLLYEIPVEQTVPVGQKVADFIDFLVEQGADLNLIHLIGHSVGAHVCAYAGRYLKSGRIPRITGLDPALPGFISLKNGLQKSDAQFVDIIHTIGAPLTYDDNVGDVDFYPNGGWLHQSGCILPIYCDHLRSALYFSESINRTHKFISYKCNNRIDYFLDKCSNEFALMGEPVNLTASGKYYPTTNAQYPFAQDIE